MYDVKSTASDGRRLPLPQTNSQVCTKILLSPRKEGAKDTAVVRELVNPIYTVDGTVNADVACTAPSEHQCVYEEPAQEPHENPACNTDSELEPHSKYSAASDSIQ